MRSRLLAFFVISAVGAAIGCSEILFSGYHVEPGCDSAPCKFDASIEDVADVVVPPDVDPGDVGTLPVSWAQWPMPNAPFDAGDASSVTVTAYHFSAYDGAASDGTLDIVTGLYWQKVASSGTMDYDAALAYCKTQTGRAWRLPTRIELISLIDVFQSPSVFPLVFKVDGGHFTGANYWSSSVDRTRPGTHAWSVDFGGGKVTVLQMQTPAWVICVAGSS